MKPGMTVERFVVTQPAAGFPTQCRGPPAAPAASTGLPKTHMLPMLAVGRPAALWFPVRGLRGNSGGPLTFCGAPRMPPRRHKRYGRVTR